jgi:fructokinase
LAITVLDQHQGRLARALGTIINLLDPDCIVLGGGLSNLESLYSGLPERVMTYAFTPETPPIIQRNRHGDSSGVRGAAWLWP